MVADSDAWSLGQLWIVWRWSCSGPRCDSAALRAARRLPPSDRRPGDHAEAARRRALGLGNALIALLLAAALWDMVFKPGL